MKACGAPWPAARVPPRGEAGGPSPNMCPFQAIPDAPGAAHAPTMSLPVILALSAALHLYIGARLVPVLPGPAAIALVVLLLASAVLVPAGMMARRLLRPPAADRLVWAGMLFMGLFS